MVRNIQYRIETKDHGKSIAEFLKEREYSRAVLVELKKTKTGITKNHEWACVNEQLQEGDLLEIMLQEHETSDNIIPIKYELDVLYEDEDILVINKPHNTAIHPSVNHYDDTLANYVAYYYASQNRPHVFRCMNRLDRDTSGATVIAKNLLSAAILSKQVKERTLRRTYLALVEGVTDAEGTIDLPIGRVEDSVIARQVDHENGKPAITHFKRVDVKEIEGKEVSLISLKLETGRTHQIRVHMSHIGHPLLGDFLYNPNNQMMARQALHSSEISFVHPVTRQMITVTAPIPKDMSCNIWK